MLGSGKMKGKLHFRLSLQWGQAVQCKYNIEARSRNHCYRGKSVVITYYDRSQWPCGLRRGSAAACLLGLRVRNPPGAWMSVVSVVYCQAEVSAWSWSLVQRSPTDCGVPECDREASTMRRPWYTRGCCAVGKKYIFWVCVYSLSYPACIAHAPYCHLWPVLFHNIFPHYLINDRIVCKNKKYWTQNVCFDFLYSFCLKHFSFYE